MSTSDYNPDEAIHLWIELVLGKLKNAEENTTKIEDAFDKVLQNMEELNGVLFPIFTVKDGNIIVGCQIPWPCERSVFETFNNHMKIPKKLQERLVAIDNKIKISASFKSSLADLMNPEISVLQHIHGGFRYSIEAELLSNVKSAVIEQMKKQENEQQKAIGEKLSMISPVFLATLNARYNITFKDFEVLKKAVTFEPL